MQLIYIRLKFKQPLNHGLVLQRVHRVMKLNWNAWLKPYIDMNADLEIEQKMILKNIFYADE